MTTYPTPWTFNKVAENAIDILDADGNVTSSIIRDEALLPDDVTLAERIIDGVNERELGKEGT